MAVFETCSNIGLLLSCSLGVDLAMSRCGGLKECEGMLSQDKFLQFLVTYDELCENPGIISDPNLVIQLGGK